MLVYFHLAYFQLVHDIHFFSLQNKKNMSLPKHILQKLKGDILQRMA